jgi:single-stranded-DNA-specific exonuclease
MEDAEGLADKARLFESKILASAKNNENILIVSHHDADGICGASILAEFVLKNKGHCQIRAVSEPNPRLLDKLSTSKFDLFIFVDCGSGLSFEIGKKLGDKWLAIDHHEISKDEIEYEKVLNGQQFGFDGSTSVCSSSLCYLVTRSTSERSMFLSLVGAIADRQDVGPRRSLVGLNAKNLEAYQENSSGIDTKLDLLLWSRETRPVHDSIANTLTIFVPGLTGNRDACLASLRGAGLELRASSRWKTISEFGDEEKQKLLETIVPHLSGTSYTVEDLVGSVYALNSRDEFSSIRDARDFAMLLSACGRLGKAGIAVTLCLGDEQVSPTEYEQIISDYRSEVVKAVQNLLSSEDRISEHGDYAWIIGDGVVAERLTGAVCQIIASYSRFKNKVVLLRTTTSDGDVKVSARPGRERTDYDLGPILSKISAGASGTGGGLKNAAGARFSIARQQEFQQGVDSVFQVKLRNTIAS